MSLAAAGLVFLVVFLFLLSSLSTSAVVAAPSGWALDLFSERGGVGRNVPSLPVVLDVRVILYAYVTYNQDPVQSILVAYQVDSSSSGLLLLGTAQTNATGYASLNFTITRDIVPVVPSELEAIATASPTQLTFNDTMAIPVVAVISYPVGGMAHPISTELLAPSLWVGYMALAVLVVCIVSQNRKRNIFARSRKFPVNH